MKLEGQVAVVTGGARGMGRAYANRLAELGADVVILDRDLSGAKEYGEATEAPSAEAELGAKGVRALALEADLTVEKEVSAAFAKIQAELGKINILINNAGGAIVPPERTYASSASEADTKLMFDVNYFSMQYCCQATIPLMRDSGGSIVTIGAQSGLTPYKDGKLAIYAASKSAVVIFTRYMAKELGPFGIRVNCISPGVIMTARIAAKAKERGIGTDEDLKLIPLQRFGNIDDVLGPMEFLVSDQSAYVTGQVISVCGGVALFAN